MSENSGNTFQIGLALSGAISAGAYTAGVLDFLFQALDEWERQRGNSGIPDHRVGLKVVAGASAGAITGALGAVALARGLRPQKLTAEELRDSHLRENVKYQTLRCVLPALYETWVTRPRVVAENGGIDFLSDEDLQSSDGGNGGSVLSLLNAKLLDEIKEGALCGGTIEQPPTVQPPYPYIAEPLHVYMTVSNLRGIPFTVGFGNSTYGMQTHGDRVHYAISGLGTCNGRSNPWVEADKYLSLSVATLPNGGSDTALSPEWDQYGTCALASSAFPIGLSSRHLEVPLEQYERRSYPIPGVEGVAIEPNFPVDWRQSRETFAFLNVDGGLVNNNPFDYAQYALMGKYTAAKADGSVADAAVIMVAPFPEPPTFLPEGQPGADLASIIRALFPTLINQARFRVSELGSALKSSDYSRYLVAPHRKLPGNDTEEHYTIACGLLGGFGGFLDEKFRAHDFQLGRRNCQAFLRSTFGLPEENPIGAAMKDQAQLRIPMDPVNKFPNRYPIIPLVGSANDEVPLPYWPRMGQPELEEILKRIAGRFKAVAPLLVRAQTASPLLRSIAGLGLLLGRNRVLDYVRLTILSDLVRRDQIAGWELPPEILQRLQMAWGAEDRKQRNFADDLRQILAELVSPAFNFRTVAGIAAKTHLDRRFVADALDEFARVDRRKPFSVCRVGKDGGDDLFTLASRKPKGFWSLPVISAFGNWLEPPATDLNSTGKQIGN
jgi:hypothetical protein